MVAGRSGERPGRGRGLSPPNPGNEKSAAGLRLRFFEWEVVRLRKDQLWYGDQNEAGATSERLDQAPAGMSGRVSTLKVGP